jgi:hypothetical protein
MAFSNRKLGMPGVYVLILIRCELSVIPLELEFLNVVKEAPH